ncbi:MAG: hypothetical protein R2867_09945 [Caldilineaceae bacterium]
MLIPLFFLCASLPAVLVVITACMAASKADAIRQAEERQFDEAIRLQRLGHRTVKRSGYSAGQPSYPVQRPF